MEADHPKREHRAFDRKLRALHLIVGLACAPMLIITSTCGALLLLRKTGLYARKGSFRDAIQSLHSYELFLPYVGLIACCLMLIVTVTGLLLVLRTLRHQNTSARPRAADQH